MDMVVSLLLWSRIDYLKVVDSTKEQLGWRTIEICLHYKKQNNDAAKRYTLWMHLCDARR